MPWLKLRDVCPIDAECEAEIEAARKKYKRFDDAWQGVLWLLARDPQPPGSFDSMQRDGVDYYIYGFRGDASVDIPDMWIFYEFDDEDVRIHGINANDAPEDDEE
jgi:hypothetical protein